MLNIDVTSDVDVSSMRLCGLHVAQSIGDDRNDFENLFFFKTLV
jgi:hypothetical protein